MSEILSHLAKDIMIDCGIFFYVNTSMFFSSHYSKFVVVYLAQF